MTENLTPKPESKPIEGQPEGLYAFVNLIPDPEVERVVSAKAARITERIVMERTNRKAAQDEDD